MLSETRAMATKIATSASSCTGTCPAARSANCGSTAAKNTIAFGLVSPTTNPSRSIRLVLAGGVVPARIAASDCRCLIAWTPRKIRYAAPTRRTTVNMATERSTSAPIPNATAITWT
jgi:hypothetical protein